MKLFGALIAALLAVAGLTGPSVVSASVAGVDFGGEFFKIALVKPGTPFEIVTNVHSKRKTETMVAFDGDERLYGADAATVGVRRPQTCYAQIRRFLGTTVDDPAIASLIQDEYFPYELKQNESRGTVALQHDNGQLFKSEELVAMVFTHARQITDAFAHAPVKDWVVTVPDFFTQAQRQAMLDAAEISGVRALSLINENTAAALQLGVHSTFTEPRRVLFYNLGSTSLQVSIVEFSSQVVPDGFKKNKTVSAFEVISKAWDATLGGAKFDLRLADYLAQEFSAKIGEDVRQIPRPMAKIRAQAKKTKLVLSANENIPVVMQSLHKDIDFFTSMTRAKFEEMCSDLFALAMKPVEQALEKSGLTVDDIHEVEVIGGGVRMPKIQQQLKAFFTGKDLGVHLNGDEAMALGAAFHAANLSNSFRVRHVGMTDLASYPVGVRLVDLDQDASASTGEAEEKHWVKRASLFTETSKLGLRKAVSFLHAKDFSATFRYDKPSSLPVGASSHIAKYNITGVEAFAAKMSEKNLGEPKVTLSFELDGSGIASIAKAEVTLEEEYEVEVEVKKEGKKSKDKKSKKKDAKKDKEDEKEDADKEKEDEKDEDEKEKEEPVEMVKQIKKKTHRATLSVTHAHEKWDKESGISVLPMSVTEKKDSMRMLQEMEQADNQRRANLEAKNKLETFVYTARDTLSAQEEQFKQVTTQDQMDQLTTKLEETEEWLYDEGEKVDATAYNGKIKSLETDFNAILFRIREKKLFPEAVSNAQEYAFSTKELMAEWVESKPQVTEEERQDVLDKVDELETWLSEAQQKQAKTAAHEKPVVTSSEVDKKIQSVKKLVSTLAKKPVPKPVKTAEEEQKEGEEKKAKDGEEKKEEKKEDEGAAAADKEEKKDKAKEETSEDDGEDVHEEL